MPARPRGAPVSSQTLPPFRYSSVGRAGAGSTGGEGSIQHAGAQIPFRKGDGGEGSEDNRLECRPVGVSMSRRHLRSRNSSRQALPRRFCVHPRWRGWTRFCPRVAVFDSVLCFLLDLASQRHGEDLSKSGLQIATNPLGLQTRWTDQGLHHYTILFCFLPQSAQLFRCCFRRSNVKMKMNALKADRHVF